MIHQFKSVQSQRSIITNAEQKCCEIRSTEKMLKPDSDYYALHNANMYLPHIPCFERFTSVQANKNQVLGVSGMLKSYLSAVSCII